MYTNTATLTRNYRDAEVSTFERMHTRPRVTEDGSEVRYPRPGRRTAEQDAIFRSLGWRR